MNPVSAHEEHGEVLASWHALGLRRATIICFDRHLDLKALSPTSIQRLSAASSERDVIRSLNRPIPFQEDDRYAYGLDNFILAAGHLGILDRLIWVHPEPEPLTTRELAEILWNRLSLVAGHGHGILNTFEQTLFGARARVDRVDVEITTPRRLGILSLPNDIHLDFDLDFFGTEQGKILHHPDYVLNLLNELGLQRENPTLTWSITSGFLPESLAWVGPAVAKGLNCTLVTNRRAPLAPLSMRLLTSGAPLSQGHIREVIEQELEPLGGAGYSLGAVLYLQAQQVDIDMAISLWERARASGDGASWPAYSIGLALMKHGDYSRAAQWFERGQGQSVDTIQLHGGCMRAVCLARMALWEEALALAQDLSTLIPMRQEPWVIGRIAATELERPDLAESFTQLMPKPIFTQSDTGNVY